jgi:hypothetical protein
MNVVGAPSIELVSGYFRVAVTVNTGGDFPTYRLVYISYNGTANTTCLNAGSPYQCDILESSTALSGLGAPSLDVAPDQTVGIAYFRQGEGIKYAYPRTGTFANCGPTPKAWRCISIWNTGKLSTIAPFDFGVTSSQRGIVFTYDESLTDNTLSVAQYVGSGGNCGLDKSYIGTDQYQWKCSNVDVFSFMPNPTFSINMDPDGYAVIAYNNALTDLSPVQLYLAYPNARAGLAGTGWVRQKIDGAPSTTIQTGGKAALALNSAGAGLIGYLQEEDYMIPDVKLARQIYHVYLPALMK